MLQQMFKGVSRCTCALILEYSRIRRIQYFPHPRLRGLTALKCRRFARSGWKDDVDRRVAGGTVHSSSRYDRSLSVVGGDGVWQRGSGAGYCRGCSSFP
ncbi:hypothetical protein GUITHDRAFT_149760, partial [Guillardia theta CCMP2712]